MTDDCCLPRRPLALAVFLAMPITLLTGCSITINSSPPVPGSGTPATDERTLDEFTEVSLSIDTDVEIVCGGEQSVAVTSDDNLVPLITTRVVNGVLRIDSDHNLKPTTDTRVAITVPQLSAISLSGSGDISIQGMEATEADISISGSGSVTGDITAEALSVSIAGSGDLQMTGTVASVDVSVAGSGDVRLAEVTARTVSVSVAGSGDVSVHADDKLDVSIAGSGSVEYGGNPSVSRSVLGSGSITQRPQTAEKP